MNTFLPYPDFKKCARVIDDKRLWKQILEANQLLILIRDKKIKSNWRGKHVYKMWEDNPHALEAYRDFFVIEWLERRLINPPKLIFNDKVWGNLWPKWIGNKQLHASHRAALLAKNPEWYGQFGWREEPKIDYFWPIDNKTKR